MENTILPNSSKQATEFLFIKTYTDFLNLQKL